MNTSFLPCSEMSSASRSTRRHTHTLTPSLASTHTHTLTPLPPTRSQIIPIPFNLQALLDYICTETSSLAPTIPSARCTGSANVKDIFSPLCVTDTLSLWATGIVNTLPNVLSSKIKRCRVLPLSISSLKERKVCLCNTSLSLACQISHCSLKHIFHCGKLALF